MSHKIAKRKRHTMKTLCFDSSKAEQRQIFSDLYGWFKSSGESSKGVAELRIVDKILTKFEGVGTVIGDTYDNDVLTAAAMLIKHGFVVEFPAGCVLEEGSENVRVDLEDAHFERLRRDIDATGFKNFGARRALRVHEFLEEAAKHAGSTLKSVES